MTDKEAKMKKFTALLVVLVMLVPLFAVNSSSSELAFTDVPTSAWYYNDVKNAVGMGLINGKTPTTYCPDNNLTYAEAFKLAACMNQLALNGAVTLKNGEDMWYSTYIEYCTKNGILSFADMMLLGEEFDPNVKISRSGYMSIFANALPDEMLPAINYVPDEAIPDVNMSANYSAGVYKLYRAGILQGSDEQHNCKPYDSIKRSEVAAILTRMMDKTKRVRFDMGTPVEYEPFKIVEQPKSVEITKASDAVATVKVEGGVKPYKYSWHYNYEGTWIDIGMMLAIEDDLKGGITGYDTEKLSLFSSATDDDIGDSEDMSLMLKCVVTDAVGNKLTTNVATITVKGKGEKQEDKKPEDPVKVTVSNNQFRFLKGDRLGIEATAAGGAAPYTKYTWYRLKGSEWVNFDSGATLYIDDSRIDAPGETFTLKCVVTDSEGGTGESETVTVTTSDFILEKGLPEKTDVVVGNNVSMSVKASGGKAPYKYEWYETTFVVPTKDYTMSPMKKYTDSTVEFTMVPKYLPPSDNVAKGFKCIITDAEGSKVETFTGISDITPDGMPLTIVQQPQRLTNPKCGSELLFDIAVYGGTEPYSYEWFYETRFRNDVTKHSLNSLPQTQVRRFKSELNIKVDVEATILDKEIFCVVTDAKGNSVTSEKIAVCPDYLMIALEDRADENLYVGTVKCGELLPNDRIAFYGRFGGEEEYVFGTVEKIEMFNKSLDKAEAGDRVGIYLKNVKKYEKQEDLKEVIGDPEYRRLNTAFKALPSVLNVTTSELIYGTTPGEDVNLNAYITGGSESYTLIEWYKEVNGSWELLGSTKRGILTKNNAGYLMQYAYRGEKEPTSIKAKCIVTDSEGNKAESAVVTLVTSDITFEKELPESIRPIAGDTLTYSVKVKGGTEPYTYNWYLFEKKYDGSFTLSDLKNDKTASGYDTDTVSFVITESCISTSRQIEKWEEWSLRCKVTDASGASVTTQMTIG